MTNLEYNSRGLLTEKSWTVPGGSGITDPTDVTFSYDNLGNRTQMTDGLGVVEYEYSSLSQLLSETRDFADTLVDAPISGGKFKLEYSYALSGQLKSLKDPYGQQFNYGHDKSGRLQTVTGSTAFNGITNYASSPTYNARGNLTGLSYGNGTTMSVTGFNAKLQATGFEVKKGTTGIIEKEYEFYNDGSLKFIDDGLDSTFDRLYKYDHQARTVMSGAGTAARGESPSEPTYLNQPYTMQYTHGVFGQIESMNGYYYNTPDEMSWAYANNRNLESQYDNDGNETADEVALYETDAAGRLFKTTQRDLDDPEETYPPTVNYFGGDGQLEKRTRNFGSTTPAEVTNYYIRSSILNKVISETDGTGKKLKTYVPANGVTLAEQNILQGTTEAIYFIHQDASGSGAQQTKANGDLLQTTNRSGEYDALGRNIADPGPYVTINEVPPGTNYDETNYDLFGSGQGYRPGQPIYYVDGQVVPHSYFFAIVESGVVGGLLRLLETTARMSAPRLVGNFVIGSDGFEVHSNDAAGMRSAYHTELTNPTWLRVWAVSDNSWAIGSLISSGQRQTQEGTFRKGKKGLQQAPPIDDDKFKTCLSDLFFISSVESYDPGKSFAGRVKDDSWIAMLAILFGGENPPTKRITVTTTAVSSSMLSFLKNGTFGTPGVLGGYTPSDDSLTKYWRGETPDRNYITNDFGSAKFQESMWVYELGNSLGWQTGHTPEAINEENRYGDRRERNDKGGPALMDCVYGGKVGSRGEIESTPN